MRTLTLLLAVSVATAFTACGDDDGSDSASGVPIMQVMTFRQNERTPAQFAPRGFVVPENGPQPCLIHAVADKYVAGTCEWQVEEGVASWGVAYIETWKCADLEAAVGDGVFCPGETGRHEWHYGVTPDGTVQLLIESGDTPPESAGSGAPER